jgi:hypothetical protein
MTLRSSAHRRFPGPTPKAPNGLSPLSIGFWLGGGLLGPGGCILGVCMPYHHPVAVVISALWWGIYLGSLGASVGALIVLLTERRWAPASRGVDGRSPLAAPATLPVSRSVPQEERVNGLAHKPERQHCPARMVERAENQSILAIRPGAFKE